MYVVYAMCLLLASRIWLGSATVAIIFAVYMQYIFIEPAITTIIQWWFMITAFYVVENPQNN